MFSHDALIPAAEAKQTLGLSNSSFYRLIARGNLDAVKVGRRTSVRLSEIERFILSRPKLIARSGLAA